MEFPNHLRSDSPRNVTKMLSKNSSSEGDSILIESGHLHAIDGGNLILEIQQNSDTTYRVYDWDRVDSNGNSRELHIEELKCINFNISNPKIIIINQQLRKTVSKFEALSY